MDGTLVDSEELHWVAWRETMAAESVPITHEQFLASFGRRNEEVLSRWLGSASTQSVSRRFQIQKTRVIGISFAREVSPHCPGFHTGWHSFTTMAGGKRLRLQLLASMLKLSWKFWASPAVFKALCPART
jgi:hypothetical protein